jgi:GntR family carbon starvation induced transcriptional regulator
MDAVTSKSPMSDGPRTLASRLVGRLRADIVGGTLLPGEKLKLGELSFRYNCGVNPLREALARLAASGLVVLEDQKGFRVAPVSREDLLDLTRVRQKIECWALRESIEKGDVEWEARIVSAHHRLGRLTKTVGDERVLSDAWETIHQEFHLALVSGCGSRWLLHFRNVLAEQTSRYRRLSVAYAEAPRDIGREHDEIVAAALARDADRAETLISAHFARTASIVVDGYERMMRAGANEREDDHGTGNAAVHGRPGTDGHA